MIKYNNEDKTPNEKGWTISVDQLTDIQQQVGIFESEPTLEQIEAVLLVFSGEVGLLENWHITKEDLT